MSEPHSRARGIDRVVQVLEFLKHARRPVGIGALAKEISAPRSSLYEIVNTLTAAGILETVGESQVYFGRTVYFYADAYLASQPLVRIGRDEVIRLATITGETAQLCMLLGDKYTVAHMQPGSNLFRISSETGVLVPIPWTASGRLLLAGMSDAQIRSLVPPEDFRLPDGRDIRVDEFLSDVHQAHSQGFAKTTALADKFTTCLAAPIVDATQRPVATLCFVIPAGTDDARQADLMSKLVAGGRAVSERLQA